VRSSRSSGAGYVDYRRRFTTADLRAGYTYELAFRQFEISDTRVFDRPAAGRAFFEGVIRDCCATLVMSTEATSVAVMNGRRFTASVFTLSPSCSSCRGLVFTLSPGGGQSRPLNGRC